MHLAIECGLFAPLFSFFVLMALSNWVKRPVAGIIACAAILISFVCFSSLLASGLNSEDLLLFRWLHYGKINADFTLHVDHLSLVMTLIITGVGFLIHVYSIGYMDHDTDYARFFACLNFFVFAMLLLVLAGDLLVLFVGWEGVGLASYLLIGFWYQRPAAAEAATKAFVVNRIGDLGFLIGLLLTYTLFGTSDIGVVTKAAAAQFAVGAPVITLLTLLFFVGATGKSAQIPLHVWLPDAMEGPTPVSALIHAATMVTAGVYLVVRLHVLFMLAPMTLQVIGVIGAVTSLFAALCAVGQTDLKRVLAYSTVSQLGLMFLACGAGAFYSAMFHLTMHAFVKALLFLSAGNVVHMMHGITDMGKMGGLSKVFTKTHWLFLVGVLALSGIPPLATFFSKDLILEQEFLAGFDTLFYIGLAASILTGFYLTRAYCLTFTGVSKLDNGHAKDVKEAPLVMLIPVAVLGVLSVAGGFLGFSFGKTPLLEDFISQVGVTLAERELSTHIFFSYETVLAIGGAFLGVGSSAYIFTHYADRPLRLLKKSFYIDVIYNKLFVLPLKALSKLIARFFEPKFFEGILQVITQDASSAAHWLQRIQSGQIRSYAAWLVAGSVLLIIYIVF